jgi:demethylmenaquinone methyltransferase/2-methoxy-6-polyprenyl-1,4-benzoquinol methylase
MNSRTLPTASEKPRFVAAMFARIARRYDLMNSVMTAGQDARWRRMLAEAVLGTTSPVGSILDVGTGTGKLAEAIQHAAPRAHVVGVDFAEPMLRASSTKLRLAAADALLLPFADAHFDVVVSAFVVRNLADVTQGIAEQTRVLKRGGRLAVLETTPGPKGILRPFFRLYFRQIVPLLGRLIAGDSSAYTYLPESTLAFVEPTRLAELLRHSGLVDISVRRLMFGCVAMTLALKP